MRATSTASPDVVNTPSRHEVLFVVHDGGVRALLRSPTGTSTTILATGAPSCDEQSHRVIADGDALYWASKEGVVRFALPAP